MHSDGQGIRSHRGWLAVGLIAWCGCGGVIAYSLPQFRRLFEDMAIQPLPLLMQLYLSVPNSVWIAVTLLGGGLLVFAERTIGTPHHRRGANLTLAAWCLLVLGLYALAVFLVLTQVKSGLGG